MRKYRLALLVLLVVGLGSTTAYATTSQLVQQILPANCILTTVTTGNGQQIAADCSIKAPIITEVTTTPAGTRVVRGVVDAAAIQSLRVQFRGIFYTAGVSGSPLTLVGDSWTFSLSAISPLVPGGVHEFTIEALGIDGQVLSTTEYVTIPSFASVTPDPGSIPETPSNAAHGFSEISAPAYSQLNVTTGPLKFETDFFGNTRIWIDSGSESPKVLYQTLNTMSIAGITAAIVGVFILAKIITIAVIGLIQKYRP